jgi:DNA polymerase IV (DinB-like DNA polymerase)
MAISEALDKLPRRVDAEADPTIDEANTGHYRPVDMEFYKNVASDVKDVLYEHADVVREVSIDEAYLDVTERTDWAEAEAYAEELRRRIKEEAGVTASVGVAPNMSAAKIASDYDKPDGLVVVEPGEVREFLAPLEVEEIHGVGPVSAEQLHDMGLDTAADIAGADPHVLEDKFGDRGRELYVRARGEDTREVEPMGLPKSLSKESALAPTTDMERKEEILKTLSSKVAERVEAKECLFQTVGIKVVEPPFDVNTRAKSLSGPVDATELIEEYALELLEEFDEANVRKLGVRVSKLSFTNTDQAQLGDWGSSEGESSGSDGGSGLRDRLRSSRSRRRSQRKLGDFETDASSE